MEMDGDGIPKVCAGSCMQVEEFEEFIKMGLMKIYWDGMVLGVCGCVCGYYG